MRDFAELKNKNFEKIYKEFEILSTLSTLCFLSRFRPAHGRDRASARKGNRNTMRYYDYIQMFNGADHPFGDLAMDIKKEVESNGEPDELLDIYKGDFSEIYDHLMYVGASKAAVYTFVESWAAYLKHDREEYEREENENPVPFVVADQLREINQNLKDIGYQLRRHNNFMEIISDSLYSSDGESIPYLIDQMVLSFGNCVDHRKDNHGNEHGLIRICGVVDTYEQN